MTDLVPAEDIEGIVGVKRHATEHWGRAVSAEQRVYILHSQECLDDPIWGLQDCLFSLALDQGIELSEWVEDVPVKLDVRSELRGDWLIPASDSDASQATTSATYATEGIGNGDPSAVDGGAS